MKLIKPLLVVSLLTVGVLLFGIKSSNLDQPFNEQLSVDPKVPSFLVSQFPKTDWSNTNESIHNALSGGPRKDGIPSIDNPIFYDISQYDGSGNVQAIVLKHNNAIKAYPYNILVWHEIVNDEISGKPVSVTFCPLCGSAAVFERVLGGEETTFGVSGALIESNMVMYDRVSESMWQQSTGEGLAGTYNGSTLARVPFQLLTMKEIENTYPGAQVLSENTGFSRDYKSNPYAGYNESDEFVFSPSQNDVRYPSKEIFVAYSINNTPYASPWLTLKNDEIYTLVYEGETYLLTKKNNELEITDPEGNIIPFYFEMWFSWAVQHQDNGRVFDPNNN